MSDASQGFFRRHWLGTVGVVAGTLVPLLYLYLQLVVWKRHGDDLMLTAVGIIVTVLLWGFLTAGIVKYWKASAKAEAIKSQQQLLVELIEAIKNKREEKDQESPRANQKLAIRSAIYAPVEAGGKSYDVTEFIQHIISRDTVVLHIENHNFATDEKNYVPHDPLPGKLKRLQVEYSYDGSPDITIERREHTLLVLPEDSEIGRLASALKTAEAALDARLKTEPQGIAGKTRELANDLYSFLKEIGPEPKLDIPKGLDVEEQVLLIGKTLDPWQDRMFWGYEHKFKQRVADFIVELRANGIDPGIRELPPAAHTRDKLKIIREQAERFLVLSMEIE